MRKFPASSSRKSLMMQSRKAGSGPKKKRNKRIKINKS
jgi:hypothetical protein